MTDVLIETAPTGIHAVPWQLVRGYAPLYGLKNASLETLRAVGCTLDGPGSGSMPLPRTVAPGETLWLDLGGVDTDDALIVVRWLRSDRSEYLWRIAF